MDLRLDLSQAEGKTSPSQIAGTLTEHWVGREMFCLACPGDSLTPTKRGTPSRDFNCGSCHEPYELKATYRGFGHLVPDGAFHTMLSTVRSGRSPNLLLLQYDRSDWSVRDLAAIHRTLLSAATIVPRKHRLAATARRAGWLGCSIDIAKLPTEARIPIVEDRAPRPESSIRDQWSRFGFMVRLRPGNRGWLADTLSAVSRFGSHQPFRLSEVYQFEAELSELHPGNRNVRPKIRQQLQILVTNGLIRRIQPGVYERVESRFPSKAPA